MRGVWGGGVGRRSAAGARSAGGQRPECLQRDVRRRVRRTGEVGRAGLGAVHVGRGGAGRGGTAVVYPAEYGGASGGGRGIVGGASVTEAIDRGRGGAAARDGGMKVYLVDGTYELFRHFFAVPSQKDAGGVEIGAVRGV